MISQPKARQKPTGRIQVLKNIIFCDRCLFLSNLYILYFFIQLDVESPDARPLNSGGARDVDNDQQLPQIELDYEQNANGYERNFVFVCWKV